MLKDIFLILCISVFKMYAFLNFRLSPELLVVYIGLFWFCFMPFLYNGVYSLGQKFSIT